MNKGDTLRLNLDFVDDDGNPITENQFAEMELQLNPDTLGVFSLKYKLSDDDIVWDEEAQKYFVMVSEEDSFKLPNEITYQLRCINEDGAVISSEISSFLLGDVLSKDVLDAGSD